MAFSGALTLTDLNDFINPSQACIKPVEQKDAPRSQEKEAGAALTEIMIDSSGTYYEVSSLVAKESPTGNTKLAQAHISLNDCLACSGCITSAESVLITLQSHTEVLNFLASNAEARTSEHKIPVVSIAPQSLASLAASLSSTSCIDRRVTPRQVLRRLKVFCKDVLGFAHVFDTTFARELALREHVKEFLERKEAAEKQGEAAEGQLPMLASACPGWICYAEKAHSEMLPFIAKTKSPQQVMGTLVKSWMGPRWGKTPDGVYHVTVMPCYDKKLEASRKDFYDELYATRDVDCVITTGELEMMIREKGWDLSAPVPGELEMSDASEGLPELVRHPGTSSGSYLQSIMEHIERTWEGPVSVSVKMIRNSDYEEYTITEDKEGGKVVFKGAKCYGFRNLQNIVRKVGKERGVRTGAGAAGRMMRRTAVAKKGDVEKKYDYVEVMACPGGCVNGGGQLKGAKEEEKGADGVKWGSKELTGKVEEAYWDGGDGDSREWRWQRRWDV
ncbi:iron hydrogenase [Gymnopilus junonius]|uniref:Cytosolic Fe-S cluster assembly factor NAR1 n=1 Tax=Gymnopilus junonius TaxID=109634 RepID=A0A9P5NWD4_GYMJU|nr:iron hydrogenase [Gymnopilus junonius]